MTVEDLTDENYLGTDGTVVGMYGGKTPYTLDTNLPRVSEYSADVDPQTKKITVNLKVSNQ